MYIKTEDPDLPAFYFDPLINPISHRYAMKVCVDVRVCACACVCVCVCVCGWGSVFLKTMFVGTS